MLLSITIIGILGAVSAPVFNSFVIRNDLDVAGQQVASALRRAQTYARGMDDDSAWSVAVQPGTATLYKGTTFVSRDAAYDEVINLPATISVSGLSNIPFTKFTGLPGTTGTITLTSTNDTRTITINTKGMVNY
jgi:type II secretory pathway pseudopilin PulG